MTKSRLIRCFLLLAVFCSLSCLPVPSCLAATDPATYTITAEQLTTLQNNLNQLQINNTKLRAILAQQSQAWTAVSDTQTGQAYDLATLNQQLTESQTEIQSLQTQLQQVRQDLQTANQSLTTANAELQNASQSYIKFKKIQERTENRLTWQRNLWALGAGLVCGLAIWNNNA